MTALHEAIEYSALGWVKPELDETLRLVRVEVEGFADDPTDTSRMRVCTELLHQVQGTLRMVELYAPAMVAEEMERLSVALQNGEGVAGQGLDCDVACSALMRGVVLLPDYLERLQSGHKEISIVLLPMLNELRAARGEAGLSESALFVPDLDRALPASLPRAAAQPASNRANEVSPYLARLRDALRAWPEQGAPGDAEGLHFAAEALLARTSDESQRRMLWVASMVAGALRDGAMTSSAGLRQAFASVDREARGVFDQGGFDTPRPEAALEPTRQLLYHVTHSESVHPALMKLREVFDLDALRPTESELDHARGSVAGRNRSLLDTVAAAVKEDLLRVKDALDLYLRTSQKDPVTLRPQAEALQRVADTLGMLGLGLARTLVQQQRDSMQDIVDGKRQADETALLDIAGALLYVDASLDDQVARLASGDGAETEEDLAGAEARKVLDVLLREAITNFAAARQAFDGFVETAWNHAELVQVPKLLREVSGALNILELQQPAQYLDGVRMYTEIELLDRHRIPNGRQLDTFADALASLEYYLEALRDRRAARDDILDITRNSLETLGYWPLPAERTAAAAVESPAFAPPAADPLAADAPAIDVTVVDSGPEVVVFAPLPVESSAAQPFAAAPPALPAPVEALSETVVERAAPPFIPLFLPPREAAPAPAVAEIPPAAAAAVPAAAVSAGFDTTSDDIDDEIREIFLEEFEEEIANLGQLLPAWKTDPSNIERLQPVRRVFHTLKGSGRLVGAKTLGEFSWKIENMLNRVRDGHRPATSPVIAMVDQAYMTLPQLHAALRGDGVITADLHAMEAFAERIAGGEEVMPVLTAATVVEAAPVVGFEPVTADFTPGATVEDDGTPVSVDAVLLEILQAEVGGHLITIDGWLARARSAPALADEPLVRAIHTMNGAFAMTEVPSITDALTPAEGYARRLLASGDVADNEGVAAVAELTHRIRDTITALSTTGGRVPNCAALAARFVGLRDHLPESRPVSVVDEPYEFAHDDTHAPREIELTDLDLSAYGNFDVETPALPVIDTAGAASELKVISLDADAEDELAKLLGQSTEAPAASLTPVEIDSGVANDPEDAKRLLALMESFEAERIEADRLETERLEAERLEVERLAELRRTEYEDFVRLEAERLEAGRLEAERLETARVEAERIEAGRLEAERLETARVEAKRIEAERIEAARVEAERIEAERIEAERIEAERIEADRIEAERIEAERIEAERLETERIEAARVEAERLEAERIDVERLKAERIEADRLEAERIEAALSGQTTQEFHAREEERLEALRREAELLEAERLLAEGVEPEQGEHIELPAFADFGDMPAAIPVVASVVAKTASAVDAPTVLVGANVVDPDVGLDMSDLDSDLVDIFVEEGHDLLDHSDQMLVRLRERSDDRDAIIGLQRDLHTLKGGARMAGIMAIGELGHAMESLLEAAAEHRLQLEKQDIPLMERGFDRLHTMVTRVGDRRAVAMPDILITAFDARAIGIPVELPVEASLVETSAAFNAELVEDTVDETAHEHTAVAEADVVEADAVEADAAETGTAEAAAFAYGETIPDQAVPEETLSEQRLPEASDREAFSAEELAAGDFAFEDFSFETPAPQTLADESAFVDETSVPDDASELVEQTLVEHTFTENAFGDEAISEFHAPPESAASTADDATIVETVDTAEAVQDDVAVAAPSVPSFTPLPALKPLSVPMEFGVRDDDDVGLRGSQEQVRVRAELLDRLVNYAGEVAIYRSRLEQQLGAFRGATAEMEQTNTRLRDQLRRLDIETEAQIIARYQREGETRDATFDPLELDRFSNLQQLSRALAETAADLGSLHSTLDDLTQGYETLLLQQSRVSSELQEGLMRTRMVPFDTVVPRLRRVLRQAATDTGKQVQLKLEGAQGELDRNVLERMTAPLEHMLRNAVAHGLELPAQRNQAGKSEEGYVLVSVRKEGSEVVLQISDDGNGLDRRAIRARGEMRGLVRKGAVLSNAQLDALILEPGFSTAEEVSRLAGRGVGMDVVASEVRQLGGTLDIHSEKGTGTVFTLRLPQTLAVTQAAFVRIGETTFAVPIASVRGVGRIRREELVKGDLTSYRYGNEEYVLHDLGKLLGHAPAKAEGQLQMPLLLTRSGDLHIAVTVDQIIGNREIVVKPIGPQVASIPGIFGATIMGDGSVMVILDIAPLVRRQAALLPEIEEEAPQAASEQRAVPLVMVVDDSITMRKVSSRVLERNNFEVVTAKDGIDALERMAEVVPDLMLLDIEMPRMDGYELATIMKADPRLANVPIIMITSRTGDKHRQRAMDIGVDRYLGKPYQENELMRNVFSLLETVRPDA